ncbi:hypothetical protein K1719_024149 [Acacia pycnantha]|nr:hypothetical protein K1719_024149 [Acacia pycnantha]
MKEIIKQEKQGGNPHGPTLPGFYNPKFQSIFNEQLHNSSPPYPEQFLLPRYTLSKPRILCSSSKDDNNPSNFCIIEGPETVQDFVQMQLQEIDDNIKSRRNKIFLLMEEVRRLRVQQRLKSMKFITEDGEEANEMPEIPSSIPFLPHVVSLKDG